MSSATASAAPAKKRGSGLFQGLQKVGRSLQLPIAVLPAAGILLRLGQTDVQDKLNLPDKVTAVFATAGGAIFDNLPMLFCIGVAIGFAKKADGSTALAALVGFLVYSNVLKAFPVTEAKVQDGADIAATYNNPGVLGGILMGLAGRGPVAAVPPQEAGGLAGLLQRPPARPDHHGLRRHGDGCLLRSGLGADRRGHLRRR
ncbi:hypothetical protein RKD24_002538 [Streptomyces calvus]